MFWSQAAAPAQAAPYSWNNRFARSPMGRERARWPRLSRRSLSRRAVVMSSSLASSTFDRRVVRVGVRALALLLIGALVVAFVGRCLSSPDMVWLMPEDGASWIRLDKPMNLFARTSDVVRASFRTEFVAPATRETSAPAEQTVVTIHALKLPRVLLDGRVIYAPAEWSNWRVAHRVDLTGKLAPGKHELQIDVHNVNGPCALLAHGVSLDILTNGEWQGSDDGSTWQPVRTAEENWPVEMSRQFPPAGLAFGRHLITLGGVFVAVMLFSRYLPSWLGGAWGVLVLRVGLLLLWVALAANNFGKLSPLLGYDASFHIDYVRFIAERGHLPLATDGMQMFQSPLYYLILAPVYKVLSLAMMGDEITLWRILRLFSTLCGALQIELCYRAIRGVWPSRFDLQALGAVFGGLLPMNLYASQAVSNEPLASTLTAATIVVALHLINAPDVARRRWALPCLGLLWGLAMLAKVTPVLLLPSIVILLKSESRSGARRWLASMTTVCGAAVLATGWYYARNCFYFGKPFVAGWASDRGLDWWQDPGFRTIEQCVRFGGCLTYPIYSGACSFWDGLYSTFWLDGWLSSKVIFERRPPWNYTWLLAGAWLAVLPTGAMLIGAVSGFTKDASPPARSIRFAVLCIVVYLAAMMWLFLNLPIYSTVKATYLLGLTPCFALLFVAGLERLTVKPGPRSVVVAGVACWATAAYLAYFVA
ncbi:MAG: hypothetical protein JSS27_11515 [Planctomycetes bacterium]|nr:hypothetical protein [Planctomycetota bacterium]